MLFLKFLFSIATLWHVCAFAAGGVYVFHAYRVLFFGGHNPAGLKVIRTADVHLWLSGATIIILGVMISGVNAATHNQKLWAKIVVILIWLASTQTIRRYAAGQIRTGNRPPMLLASALNVACWVFGAFLGVAKPLALNGLTLSEYLLGFDFVFVLAILVTIWLENKYGSKQQGLRHANSPQKSAQ